MSTVLRGINKAKKIAILVILLVVIFGLVKNLLGFYNTKERFAEAEAEVSKLEVEKALLESQLNLEDEEFVKEKQLRDSLGLSKPGEAVVIMPEELIEKTLKEREEEKEDAVDLPNWKKWANLFL